MSISASIKFDFNKTISPIKIIHMLLDFGWTLNDYGKISYLPLGDDDMFDWKNENISFESLIKILEEKENKNELIGISMTWQESLIGGNFLLEKEKPLLFCIEINRQTLHTEGLDNVTNFNWYLTKLLPAFNTEDTWVERFSCDEHI